MKDRCEYCVYVLQSKKDKGLYIGYTNDLEKRIEEHNKDLCPSIRDGLFFRIAAYEVYSSEVDVRTREKGLSNLKMRIKNC